MIKRSLLLQKLHKAIAPYKNPVSPNHKSYPRIKLSLKLYYVIDIKNKGVTAAIKMKNKACLELGTCFSILYN